MRLNYQPRYLTRQGVVLTPLLEVIRQKAFPIGRENIYPFATRVLKKMSAQDFSSGLMKNGYPVR